MVTLILTALGACVATACHLSVSRHAPPPGWGYAWAVYEGGLPLLLLAAEWLPHHAPALHSVAAGLALLGGAAALVAVSWGRAVVLRDIRDAHVGRAVARGTRWRRHPSAVALELERWELETRRRLASRDRGDDSSDPPPEA